MEIKIADLSVMNGPSYWSTTYSNLIVMKLDLSEVSGYSSDKLFSLQDKINKLLPGALKQENNHTQGAAKLISSVVIQLCKHFQIKLGIDTAFAEIYPVSGKDSYYVIYSYTEEETGCYIAVTAVRLVEALLNEKEYPLQEDLIELEDIYEYHSLGPSTEAIVKEAVKRNIPYRHVDESIIVFGQGIHQKRIQGSICETTSTIGVDIASDKEATKALLDNAFIPVPKGIIVQNEQELEQGLKELEFPLVIKPIDGNHGKGITTNITSYETLKAAFERAKDISSKIILEKYITGEDFRLLVINYKLTAATQRTPAHIIGNGKNTIRQLIDTVNSDPRRGKGHGKVMTRIEIDPITSEILEYEGLTLDTVLAEGRKLILKDTANISSGGTATDVTDSVHPENIQLAERTAKIIGLDICGIDIIAPNLSTPLRENGGVVLEVNAAPGLRMHIAPSEGKPRDVAKAIVDLLYAEGENARIPIVALTGTNGKTTTCRIMSHVAMTEGYKVGFTTTEGIYIDGKIIREGDCTGPRSTAAVLMEHTVDFAVLECARGGILKSGLAFDQCDIGIVTNVAEDHLGLKDINTIEDMARVKAVVPKSVKKEGYSILNADDDLVYAMAKEVQSNVAFFSLDKDNLRIKEHIALGGIAATIVNDFITILKGDESLDILKVKDIPITLSGKATFMIQNILPVVLAAHILKFNINAIRKALKTFYPSPEQTPGRLNLFHFNNFEVLVDYAHNVHGLKALGQYLEQIKDKKKTGIIAGIGDRRDEDILNIGKLAAQMFDKIIIRTDKDLRGRSLKEITDLITQGIKRISPDKPIKIIPGEAEAITYAIRNAEPQSLIVISTEAIKETIEVVKKLKKEAMIF